LLDRAARPPLVASRTRRELVAPVRSTTAVLLHFAVPRSGASEVEPRMSALTTLSILGTIPWWISNGRDRLMLPLKDNL
jgi:hypothetical protein